MKNRIRLFTLATMTGMLLAACGGDDSSTDNTVQVVANPTYHKDIAPMLYEHCVKCHKADGIAPFSLLQSENGQVNAVTYAELMNSDIQTQTMPPWLADNSGQCNTFEHARWMADGERKTFANWVNTDKPIGDEPASPPNETQLPTLTNPDSVAAMSADYTPAGDPINHPDDDYRCFIVDPNITTDQDQLLTAFEVQPGNNALVHHIILFGLPNAETEAAAQALDDAESGLGYTCFGGSNVTENTNANVMPPPFLAGWAPGTKMTEYPQGTGVRLAAGRKLVMQVHYNLLNLDQAPVKSDLTSVKLKYTPADITNTIKEAFVYPVADKILHIPLGASNHLETATISSPGNIRVWGAFPHMHTNGKSIDARFTNTNNGDTCLFNVPRWNFEWQQFFFYEKSAPPIIVKAGDTVTLNCHYDTSGKTGPEINWGEGTKDEMCLSFFYITAQ